MGPKKELLRDDFYNDLLESKDDIKLDMTIFGHFDRWFQANDVRDRYSFFFKCFQQGDMFRFIIKKRSRKK